MNPDKTTQKYPNCIFPHDGKYEVFIYPSDKDEKEVRVEKDLSGQDHKIQALSICLFPEFFNNTWYIGEADDQYNNERLFSEEIENTLLQDWIVDQRNFGILKVKKGKAHKLTLSTRLYHNLLNFFKERLDSWFFEKKLHKTHRFEIFLKTDFDGRTTYKKFYLEKLRLRRRTLHRFDTNKIIKHFFDMEEEACRLGRNDKKIKKIVVREDTKQDSQEKNAGIIDTLKKKLFDP